MQKVVSIQYNTAGLYIATLGCEYSCHTDTLFLHSTSMLLLLKFIHPLETTYYNLPHREYNIKLQWHYIIVWFNLGFSSWNPGTSWETSHQSSAQRTTINGGGYLSHNWWPFWILIACVEFYSQVYHVGWRYYI